MTEYIQKTNWWRMNRLWILGIFILTLGSIIAILTVIGKPIGDFTKAMVDPSVYHNAFDIVKEDERVIALLGEVQPIGFFELIEGEARYENNDQKVNISIRIKGSKKNGTMDIVANKKHNKWDYETIRIRTKKPKKIIEVIAIK